MQQIHLVSRPAAGGIKTHLAGLLTDLPIDDWQVTLHAPKKLIGSLRDILGDTRVVPLEIPERLSLNDLFVAYQLASSLSSHAIVHAHGIRAAWICLLAKKFKRFTLLVTLHNIPPKGLLGRCILRLINHGAAKVICVSRCIADAARSPKAVVIPNGVLCDNPVSPSRHRDMQKRFLALCVSRLSPEKGIDILITAAKTTPEIDYVIAGDGPLREKLVTGAPTNVSFLGQRSDIKSLMAAADCLVVPSRSEGQGIVALEAFAAGLPVIATAVGGLTETVVDNVTGYLVPPEDPAALAGAFARLISDNAGRDRITLTAAKWVREYGRRQTQSTKVATLYSRLSGDE